MNFLDDLKRVVGASRDIKFCGRYDTLELKLWLNDARVINVF